MNATQRPQPLDEFTADAARVAIFATRAEAGLAAALDVAERLIDIQAQSPTARVVFAAAPSQDEFLAALVAHRGIAWSRVAAYHMDEYLGIAPSHPASFRRYLREHLFDPAGLAPSQLHLIPGERIEHPLRVCLDYEEMLRASPPHIVCAGIGENGHLAFNDPPVADFLDPLWIKVVRLDEACRSQQVHDGCFARIEEVPMHAFTLTVPALLGASVVSVVVPGPRKAEAVRATLRGPVAEACPASALRRHAGARIYLDRDSASLL
jgi:glucosamine-6-phosphate deaminase